MHSLDLLKHETDIIGVTNKLVAQLHKMLVGLHFLDHLVVSMANDHDCTLLPYFGTMIVNFSFFLKPHLLSSHVPTVKCVKRDTSLKVIVVIIIIFGPKLRRYAYIYNICRMGLGDTWLHREGSNCTIWHGWGGATTNAPRGTKYGTDETADRSRDWERI